MSLQSRIFERALKLPPPITRKIRVTKDLRIPAYDGVELVADLYEPHGVPNAPTLLVRTPYGRNGLLSRLIHQSFAERGFIVLMATVRGTDGAGGEFSPFADEKRDGLATLDWLEKQPWHNGKVVTFGASYLGYVQLAIAPDAGDRITALYPMIIGSSFADVLYSGGSFLLGAALAWTARTVTLERHSPLRADVEEILGDKRAQKAMNHLPLAEAAELGTGKDVGFFGDWLVNNAPEKPYWKTERGHGDRVGEITAPATLFGGWMDILVCGMLDDYAALRAAGRNPYLTIGPWAHVDFKQAGTAIPEAIAWFKAHVTGDTSALRELPVRLHVGGADEWRDYPEYPPPGVADTTLYLRPGGGLGSEPAREGAGRFTYDPMDPTPTVGGPTLDPKSAGRKDNGKLEARPDVLVHTGEVLTQPLEVIGPVSARISLRTGTGHADVFVRLCDVDPKGRSINVCDGLQTITPQEHPADDDGVRTVTVRMWPTAWRFKPGHRLRVQVSGGSFPQYARNTGTGEPLATAACTVKIDYQILPGSSITLSAL